MPTATFQQIFTYVDNACSGYIGSTVAAVSNAIAPAAFMLLGVYIALWGLASMRGLIQEHVMEFITRTIKIGAILGIAIGLGSYNVYITDTFFTSPTQFANSMTNATSNASAITALDTILDNGFKIGKAFWDKGGILKGDFGMYIIATLIWLVTILVTAYGCFLIVLAKIALSILIGLGPLFILSLLFQATGNFFNSWIQQLSNYALLIILVIAANVFVIDLFQQASTPGMTGIASSAQIDKIFPFLITGGIALLVLAQLPQIAAGLAGGISLSSYGMGRMALGVFAKPAKQLAGASLRKSAQLGGAAGKYAARKGWQYTGGKAWNAYKNRSKNTVSPGAGSGGTATRARRPTSATQANMSRNSPKKIAATPYRLI